MTFPAAAQDPAPHDSLTANKQVEDELQAGLRALYNLDYDGSRRHFQVVVDKAPGNPIGPYALTTTTWWELTNEFDEKNPALEKDFMAAADQTAKVARAAIKQGDPTGEAHLCLGGALGLKSRWEAIQGHWFKAYRDGKTAYNAQARAIEINPEMYDAYLGVGIFHYYTATLPSVVKVLARLMIARGDKQRGLQEIKSAMEKGHFSRTPAKLFLIGIYVNNEKDFVSARALLKEARQEFPRSSFFQLLEMMTLDSAKDWPALKSEADDYIARIEKGEPSYRKGYLHRGYFLLGNSFLGQGNLKDALETYDRILADFNFEDRWISWTYLNRGKTHDLRGERDKALADYRAVLKRRDVWQLHDQAKALIDDPYKQQ